MSLLVALSLDYQSIQIDLTGDSVVSFSGGFARFVFWKCRSFVINIFPMEVEDIISFHYRFVLLGFFLHVPLFQFSWRTGRSGKRWGKEGSEGGGRGEMEREREREREMEKRICCGSFVRDDSHAGFRSLIIHRNLQTKHENNIKKM